MPPLLTYGLLGLCAGVFVTGFVLDRPHPARGPWLRRLGLALQIAALPAAYLVLRPGRGTDGRAAVAASAADGRPLFVEMYSNY